MKRFTIIAGLIVAVVYLVIAVVYASFVSLFGGPILTAVAVGLQWPLFLPFWR